ncbi:MAG: response regulator [bacterium]|nr:response regulator [bacterium]
MANKILIVDDEEFIVELFEFALSSKGYDVYTALNAKDALEIFENEEIKVFFLDINMPEMNGLELCRELRRRDKDAQIIAVTGSSMEYDKEVYYQAGFNSFYSKPIALDALYMAAKKAFSLI